MTEQPKNKHAGGRPKIEIDWKSVDYYLKCQATQAQICNLLGIGVSTIHRACLREKKCSFDEYATKKRESIKQLLVGKMIDLALSGNVTMLIWLSKQHCGYSDKVESKENTRMEFVRRYETKPRPAAAPGVQAPGQEIGNNGNA